MKTVKYLFFFVAAIVVVACTPDKPKSAEEFPEHAEEMQKAVTAVTDPTKGIGAVKTVALKSPIEQERVSRGLMIFELKCATCHKLTNERLVGPGWKDVTKRRQPEWIMNMVTNVDVMLDKDPESQKLFELCRVRMPNMDISVGDARDILEYMRMNDGEK